MKPLNVLIAPDKFKGSLSSREVCSIIEKSLSGFLSEVKFISLPLADGGEGSCELLTSFAQGSWVDVEVHDPLHRKIKTKYGVSQDGSTAFLEMASASGLQLLAKDERNPMRTSTYGTGEMILHAIGRGVQKIVMGIGGSTTNDGGMGMATALGLQCFDHADELLHPVGGNLKQIARVDATRVHPALKEISFTLFCDVDNPLYGIHGAAHVFAPQKGASDNDVVELDKGLVHLEKVLHSHFHKSFDFPGAGAGGGFAVALKALSKVEITPGIKFISSFIHLERSIEEADLILTGEGQLDEQTLSGKVIKGVADLALKYRKPVIAIAGQCLLTTDQCRSLGILKVITLVGGDVDQETAFRNASEIMALRLRENLPEIVRNAGLL